MEKLKIFFQNRLNLEVFLAVTLLVIASIFGLIVELIIYLLYFMIFLEIVRVLIGFIYEKRVKIRLIWQQEIRHEKMSHNTSSTTCNYTVFKPFKFFKNLF